MGTTLVEAAAHFVADPLGMVLFDYPWGQPGPLAAWPGPDTWQIDALETIREQLLDPHRTGAIRLAVGSGHGVGKGTLMAWLVRWWLCTRPHPQAVITANTQVQLTTKTWRELAKWHQMALTREWFTWSQTTYRYVHAPETWFAQAIPWNDARPEAFQGTHDKYVLLGFDESSSIPDSIWDTAEGSLTTPWCLWVALGNLTRLFGRFTELFPPGKFAHRWTARRIDSRTARMANQDQIAQWIADYGEESDFIRVRVRGLPPEEAAEGAYYTEELHWLGAQGRFCDVPYDPTLPVCTSWDLGRNQVNAIWFFQIAGSSEVRFIDYVEGANTPLIPPAEDLTVRSWVGVVRSMPYTYDWSQVQPPLSQDPYEVHYGPHDLEQHEYSSGKTRYGIALAGVVGPDGRELLKGLRFTVNPRGAVSSGGGLDADGIAATRALLYRSVFDAQRCQVGLKALRNYRRQFDDHLQTFVNTPYKDWASNGADAFRMAAVGLRGPGQPKPPGPPPASYDHIASEYDRWRKTGRPMRSYVAVR